MARRSLGPAPHREPQWDRALSARPHSGSRSGFAHELFGSPRDPPGRPARGSRDVVVWVGFAGSSPADGTGRFSPGPTRDGSAASHLGGRVRFMQAGPPPFSRGPIVRRAPTIGNYPGPTAGRRTEKGGWKHRGSTPRRGSAGDGSGIEGSGDQSNLGEAPVGEEARHGL